MAKVNIVTIQNLTDNPSTATAQINLNFERIQEVIDLLVSRDGSLPNAMLANLDLNNFRILNLPVPVSPTEPARHGDIQQYVDEAETQADRAEAEADRAEAEADAAEQSAQDAADALGDLVSRYIGAFPTNPNTDQNGAPLLVGAIYFNTTVNNWRVFAVDDIHVEGDPVFAGDPPVIIGYWLPFPQAILRSLNDVNADAITNGQFLQWNTGTGLFNPLTLQASVVPFDDTSTDLDGATVQAAIEDLVDRTSLGRYDISFYMQGLMDNNERLFRMVSSRTFWIPVGAPNSVANSRVAANSNTVISLQKNGVQFGTLTFAAAATTGTFTVAGEEVFNTGDVFAIVAPASADTLLRDVSITLAARR